MLNVFCILVDAKRVSVRRIPDDAYASMLHDVVDVADVVLQFISGFLQLDDVFLKKGLGLGCFCDIESCSIDTQEFSKFVAHWH